jgi:hypothetical protein
MKTSFPCVNLIEAFINFNNGSKQKKANNMCKSQRRLRFNIAWKFVQKLVYDILTNNQYLIPRFAMTCFKISNIDMDNE